MALMSSPHTSVVRISTACQVRVSMFTQDASRTTPGRPAGQVIRPRLSSGEAGGKGGGGGGGGGDCGGGLLGREEEVERGGRKGMGVVVLKKEGVGG